MKIWEGPHISRGSHGAARLGSAHPGTCPSPLICIVSSGRIRTVCKKRELDSYQLGNPKLFRSRKSILDHCEQEADFLNNLPASPRARKTCCEETLALTQPDQPIQDWECGGGARKGTPSTFLKPSYKILAKLLAPRLRSFPL